MRRAKPGNQRPKRVRPPGAVVLQVAPQSAAERAGLKPGDLVTELHGTPVRGRRPATQAGAAADRRSRRIRHVEPGRRGAGARRDWRNASPPRVKANADEPPKSKAVTKAPVTASKAGNNAHPAQSAADISRLVRPSIPTVLSPSRYCPPCLVLLRWIGSA
jgi:membrane-associated protease RseP (regulator of RpoE activity)